MKKLKNLLILIGAIGLLESCHPEHPPYFYAVTSLEAGNAQNIENQLEPSDFVTIDADIYAIHIDCLNELQGGGNPEHFHPNVTNYTNSLTIQSYKIYSLEDFDATHPSGSTLNSYFLTAKEWRGYRSENTIENYIANGYLGAGRTFKSDTVSEWRTDEYLVLMKKPTELGIYNFVVEIIQSDGKLLIDTTTVNLIE